MCFDQIYIVFYTMILGELKRCILALVLIINVSSARKYFFSF